MKELTDKERSEIQEAEEARSVLSKNHVYTCTISSSVITYMYYCIVG